MNNTSKTKKQPKEVFYKKSVLKFPGNLQQQLQEKTLWWSLFFNKVACFKPVTLLKKRHLLATASPNTYYFHPTLHTTKFTIYRFQYLWTRYYYYAHMLIPSQLIVSGALLKICFSLRKNFWSRKVSHYIHFEHSYSCHIWLC